jgi:hypothetical protein
MPPTVQEMLTNALADRDRAIQEARTKAERKLATQLRAIMKTRNLSISTLALEAREAGLRGLSTRFSIHSLFKRYPEEGA